ncbi:HTH CENPB-type domain-containing protein [Trichonephila clavipes]|nr:HTH CENPB-type domain-containing protein [Trichonephila clavipes]
MIHDEELIQANELCEEVFFVSVEVDSSSDDRGCGVLKKKEHLPKGEEDIIKGGNKFDKYALIDSWTYDRFVDARENFHQVTARNLQQWALSAAGQFKYIEFKASEQWAFIKIIETEKKILMVSTYLYSCSVSSNAQPARSCGRVPSRSGTSLITQCKALSAGWPEKGIMPSSACHWNEIQDGGLAVSNP